MSDLKWTNGWDIDITHIQEEDEEPGRANKDPILLVKKGDHTIGFTDFYLLKRRIEEEFKRLFPPPWRISHRYGNEEGIEALRKYKARDV